MKGWNWTCRPQSLSEDPARGTGPRAPVHGTRLQTLACGNPSSSVRRKF
jgi:hypothetical protein